MYENEINPWDEYAETLKNLRESKEAKERVGEVPAGSLPGSSDGRDSSSGMPDSQKEGTGEKKRGRPRSKAKLSDSSRRHDVHLYISDEDYALLKYATIISGNTVSDLVRSWTRDFVRAHSDRFKDILDNL